jgi:8-oxo-dGTP pyrophosphatase MutT (NUDIX family)
VNSTPQRAATVILLREGKTQGFEVFLLKRHEKSSFMGGNYVYPGGRVDAEDMRPEMIALGRGISPRKAYRILKDAGSPEESVGHWIAGIRELFEEAGILLADTPTLLPSCSQNLLGRRLPDYRLSLQRKEVTFLQLAQSVNLSLALDELHYYAHWITPEARSQRFDTRFFLARQPFGQEASHDQKETTAGIWLSPCHALEENLRGEVVLSPPTLKTLEDLSRFDCLSDVFEAPKKHEPYPILPILTKISEEPVIIFPWDPEYKTFRRNEGPVKGGHGAPSRPGDNTTRLILREDRWHPYCRNK